MNANKRIAVALAFGWLISAVGVVIIAFLLVPESARSYFFGARVGWTVFLLFLVWLSFCAFSSRPSIAEPETNTVAGITPALFIAVVFYAIVSFLLMLLFAFISPDEVGVSRIHIAAQVGLASLLGVLFVLLSFARDGAAQGKENNFHGIPNPAALRAEIENQEARLKAFGAPFRSTRDALKSLREAIRASIPSVGSVTTSSRYRRLAEGVVAACLEIEEVPKNAGEEKLETINTTLLSLNREVRLVSTELKH